MKLLWLCERNIFLYEHLKLSSIYCSAAATVKGRCQEATDRHEIMKLDEERRHGRSGREGEEGANQRRLEMTR